jgi:hypothetical protein
MRAKQVRSAQTNLNHFFRNLNILTLQLFSFIFRNNQGPYTQHKRTFHIQLVHKRLSQFVREAQAAICLFAHSENFDEWKQDFNGELTFLFHINGGKNKQTTIQS